MENAIQSNESNLDNNYTLPDNAWKDSFDKLLEPRPILRQLNILKKEVNASFNINSSVENCSGEGSMVYLKAPLISKNTRVEVDKKQNDDRNSFISTPMANRCAPSPFECYISPIREWEFMFFDKNDAKRKTQNENEKLHTKTIDISKSRSPSPIKSKKNPRQVCFRINTSLTPTEPKKKVPRETQRRSSRKLNNQKNDQRMSLILQPGKWRKSLCFWRRTNQSQDTYRRSLNQHGLSDMDKSIEIVAVYKVGRRKSVLIKSEHQKDTSSLIAENDVLSNEYKKRVLKRCKQRQPLPFDKVYTATKMQNCRKIGEGVYGEVFLNSIQLDQSVTDTVLKIIPIEGNLEINGEDQKTYEQILPEIIISMELCNLRKTLIHKNSTQGFVNINKVTCVKGKYPNHLVKLWEEYNVIKNSENDHPEIFNSTQVYIVLELSFSGKDLEAFVFNNAEQAYYALQQIIFTLAVGELAFQFEHRDLHWGNILIETTNEKHLSYKLNGEEFLLPTKGIKTTIIDYTLSRMTFENCCLYNDLSSDADLFTATGDYQFDIYRKMREVLNNKWEKYEPKTNVFWISYLIVKMLDGLKYKHKRTKVHSTYMEKFKELKKNILKFRSAADCAMHILTLT